MINEDEFRNIEPEIFHKILTKRRFVLEFPEINFDDLTKEQLASYVLELTNKIRKIRDPNYAITSVKLVKSFLKSYTFPKLQKRLLIFLSDQQSKSKKEIINKLYKKNKKKIHNNINNEVALRQLLTQTHKTIAKVGSSDAFSIKTQKGHCRLVINATNLSIYLKKRSKKVTNTSIL